MGFMCGLTEWLFETTTQEVVFGTGVLSHPILWQSPDKLSVSALIIFPAHPQPLCCVHVNAMWTCVQMYNL